MDGGNAFKYNCMMWHFRSPYWSRNLKSFVDLSDIVERNDLGYETEPHITVLFGLKSHIQPKHVAKKWKNIGKPDPYDIYDDLQFKGISAFHNDEYDVLKIDVESPLLRQFNKELKQLPNENTYPIYHPHVTLAYLKSNRGYKYYRRRCDHLIEKQDINECKYIYSMTDGTKIKLKT